jgi:hypothetical protein
VTWRRPPAALLALWLAALGCGDGQELKLKQSAANVARAEERLRNASNPEKAAALAELAELSCFGEGPCEARDRCAAAYGVHVEALNLTQAAKLQLADDKPLDAARLLGAAEAKLKEASGKVADCTERAAALRRRHAL